MNQNNEPEIVESTTGNDSYSWLLTQIANEWDALNRQLASITWQAVEATTSNKKLGVQVAKPVIFSPRMIHVQPVKSDGLRRSESI